MNAALIDHLWQSTLFGVAAWSITLALRDNSAAVRHWLWMTASLKFLVPFSALFTLGTWLALPADTEPGTSLLGSAIRAASPVVTPAISLREAGDAPLSYPAFVLLAVWIAGVSFFALRWYAAWRAAAFITRAARPAPGAPADARITDADIEPAVARVFRPVVLLPAALLGSLPRNQLRAVLAHEREHIHRSDNLKAGIHRLVEVLFWFHPLVWWIGRQLVEERERACDEAVIDEGHDGAEYAAGILAVCRHCVGTRPRFAVSALAGNLTRRIRCILASARPAELGFFKAAGLTTCAMLLTAAPLIAGAMDDAARRGVLVNVNARTLRGADVTFTRAAPGTAERASISADARGVTIRNASLRDLVAIAYGVRPWQIEGGGDIDNDLYDVRASARGLVSDPENLDPKALRGMVARLLGATFGLEIHVNRRCQAPCGRYALAAPDTPH